MRPIYYQFEREDGPFWFVDVHNNRLQFPFCHSYTTLGDLKLQAERLDRDVRGRAVIPIIDDEWRQQQRQLCEDSLQLVMSEVIA